MSYDHQKIEKKWQEIWAKEKLYRTDEKSKKPKFYVLDMFPYPSGAGLHVGHPEGYTATDIVARYKRMNGFEVLHPMGWDAFGLPAENYAIKTGVAPEKSTRENIKTFKRQIKALGLSYDWSREIATSDPGYYKWTQWFFLLLYKNGLAYKKKAKVNWCESCKTVLANEQVIEGKCERCKNGVNQKDLRQWFFKTTAYAERLLSDLDKIDFPEKLKTMQRNWIGKSAGAEIDFEIKGTGKKIKIFTTRPDTLFGATYLVLAPEHPLVPELEDKIKNWQEVENYREAAKKKNDLERTDLGKVKTGVEINGLKVINPGSGEEIPIWVADYVLLTYGTGAVMAVPAHDERDYAFARKFNLEIREVVSGGDISQEAFCGEGQLVNSGKFNGISSVQAREDITRHVSGHLTVKYKLRDWLISRQRYWGAPIPIIYCEKCGEVPVPEKDLPVLLPKDVDFLPTGESPLTRSEEFHQITCPKCGAKNARREVDTMDTFTCSSWYYYRFLDPRSEQEFCSKEKIKKWLPVDLYVGGAEHAVGHLIYSRFFTKVLKDFTEFVDFNEPFKKLVNQGLILAEDGRKMSKSLGNVINPDEVVAEYGADTLRMYEMFMGPLEDAKPWDTKGIKGIRRFLDKVARLSEKIKLKTGKSQNLEIEKVLHRTIQKVTGDIEKIHLNTAISALMIFLNTFEKDDEKSALIWEKFLVLLSPLAPHLTEELWAKSGHKESIFKETWPKFNSKLLIEETKIIPVQVNGKVRGTVEISLETTEEEVLEKAKELQNIQKYLKDQKVKKVIYVKGRTLNLVV